MYELRSPGPIIDPWTMAFDVTLRAVNFPDDTPVTDIRRWYLYESSVPLNRPTYAFLGDTAGNRLAFPADSLKPGDAWNLNILRQTTDPNNTHAGRILVQRSLFAFFSNYTPTPK